jgi:hypothetical protein
MKKNNVHARPAFAPAGLPACILFLALLCAECSHDRPGNGVREVHRQPVLFPYSRGTVIPPNIAPLNFLIREKGDRFFVSISRKEGPGIELFGTGPSVIIPIDKWKQLLTASKGRPIGVTVYCREQREWRRFETIWDTVSVDNIDSHVAYRKIPVCKDWALMGIYQRDLGNFNEDVVLHNKKNSACFNCHSFRNNNPADMALEVRSKDYGTPMVLGTLLSGTRGLHAVNTKTQFSSGKVGFTSWHPSHDIIAFSMNRFEMLFYSAGAEPRAVFDAAADVAIFDIQKNIVTSTPELRRSDRIETMPEWSSDGRSLYFCSAPQLPEKQYRDVRCDLMRIAFDPATYTWGRLDTVLTAEKAGGSVLQPRSSPNGRFLLVTIADYSDFPIDKAGARLCLFDIAASSLYRIGPESRGTDAWHGWSHSGRWIVWNSKRMNGKFSSVFFCRCDSTGAVHAPFVLPQKDPLFYESSLTAYNVPEFLTGRIPYTIRQFQSVLDAYRSKPATDVVTAATAPHGGQDEY